MNHWSDALAFIGAALLVCGFSLLLLVQRRYVESRYRASGLMNAKYFQHPILNYFGGRIWMAGHCTFHFFLVWLLPESALRRLPGFSDLESREEVLRHFSGSEAAQTVASAGAGIAALVLMLVWWIVRP